MLCIQTQQDMFYIQIDPFDPDTLWLHNQQLQLIQLDISYQLGIVWLVD